MNIPYKIAVLIYIFNDAGQLLLLHRKKFPNKDLYSPIGGKLEQDLGESPYACALREIREEIQIDLTLADIRLMGIVSERSYASQTSTESHWLMFCFEVTKPLNFPPREFDEGQLEWVAPTLIETLDIPKTDREVIWPLVQKHSTMLRRDDDGGEFFSVHIDCTDANHFLITHET